MNICRNGFWSDSGPSLPPSLLQRKDKLRSDAFSADHIDVLIVGLDDLLGDGKPETRSLFVLAAREIGLVEAVPDQAEAVLGDADAVILHRDQQFV